MEYQRIPNTNIEIPKYDPSFYFETAEVEAKLLARNIEILRRIKVKHLGDTK